MKDHFDIQELVNKLDEHGLPAQIVDKLAGDNLDDIDPDIATIKYIEVKLQTSYIFRVMIDNEDGYAWCCERKISYENGRTIDYTKKNLIMLCEPTGYAPGDELSMASDIRHVMFKYSFIGDCLS